MLLRAMAADSRLPEPVMMPLSRPTVVDEAALYRQVCTAEVMAAQLCRLRDVSAIPSVLMPTGFCRHLQGLLASRTAR